ncbi:hypothetical protein PNOK_0933300 [Pyrrhoderma noxium]|uniref:Uncharacterized protein n=1 Tax=Pyrrhoderma noxium TaxID=2282107 RepID=A0A286U5B9_9AGAM|nr:hypothetical protein PNOK_0933300 [Pyrrhoderma noxium]
MNQYHLIKLISGINRLGEAKSISFDSLPDNIIIQILLLGITNDLEYLEPEDPKLLRPDHSLAMILSVSQTNRFLRDLLYPTLSSGLFYISL